MHDLSAYPNLLKEIETLAQSLRLVMQRVEALAAQGGAELSSDDLATRKEAIAREIMAYIALARGGPPETVLPANHAAWSARVAELRASERWAPSDHDLARGREILVREFDKPEFLTLEKFAHLADRSREQICDDIASRRLLALNVRPRGQRIPQWQLDQRVQQLTCAVLAKASLDDWTVYWALTTGYDSLSGKSPVSLAGMRDPHRLASIVLAHLGVQEG